MPKLKHLEVDRTAVNNFINITQAFKIAVKPEITLADQLELKSILTRLGWKAAEITIIIDTITKREATHETIQENQNT